MFKVISAAILAIALVIGVLRPDLLLAAEERQAQTAINALRSITNRAQVHYSRLAIGYNTNVDLIADAVAVLTELGANPAAALPHPHSSIRSLKEFRDTFANFFSEGSAAERFIENSALCQEIVAATQRVPGHEFYIGGNAALMAKRFALAAPAARVLLAGWLPDNLRTMLPSNVEFDPNAQEQPISEAHLILEYQKDVRYGDLKSPRANRFIAHCDATNARMKPMPEFHASLNEFKPELVVMAGLHLLEREPIDFQDQALSAIAQTATTSEVLKDAVVHLELASIASTDFLEKIARRIVPSVDSLGLNEQELGHVFYALSHLSGAAKGDTRSTKAAEYVSKEFRDPPVRRAIAALAHIFRTAKDFPSARPLQRIHFHSLKYHIIAQKINNTRFSDPAEALAAGSVIATSQACNFKEYDVPFVKEFDSYKIGTAPFDETNPISVYEDANSGLVYYIAPVGVCRKPGKTVGLGDAISASGLLHHARK